MLSCLLSPSGTYQKTSSGTMEIRAAASGQSLQAYARTVLARDVAEPTLADAAAAARRTARSDVTASDVLAAVDDGRAGR
ncbi:antitoxin [Nocardiopsis sp. CNT312]|uniref:antitoxin n=1 Tax=Nocardiopsis sp. CNT312 TaxID=1137268 RepID=UPI0004AF25E1|nr:antitoxin [Nocardiopsis sp. CNT312]